jgi:hypothetical protein
MPSTDRFPDPLELLRMDDVVPSVQPHHVLHAFLAALFVHSHAPELVRAAASEQLEVALTQRSEAAQRKLHVSLVVAESLRPQVLIVARKRRPIVRQHHAQPPAPYDLRIDHVRQHLPDRPLSGGLGRTQLLRRQTFDRAREGGGRLRQHAERILLSERAENGGYILAGLPT